MLINSSKPILKPNIKLTKTLLVPYNIEELKKCHLDFKLEAFFELECERMTYGFSSFFSLFQIPRLFLSLSFHFFIIDDRGGASQGQAQALRLNLK
jgi:hypothetical protein